MIKVLYFAQVRELIGKTEEQFPYGQSLPVEAFLNELKIRYPQLEAMQHPLVFAVNQECVQTSHVIQDGDEVAVFQPVSGG